MIDRAVADELLDSERDPNPETGASDATPELLTDAEVAALLRIPVGGVGDRVRRGGKLAEFVVPGMKPRRFRARDVRAWLGLNGSVTP